MATIATTAPASSGPSNRGNGTGNNTHPESPCPWIDFGTAEGRALYRACCEAPNRCVIKSGISAFQAKASAAALGDGVEAVQIGPRSWGVIAGSAAERRHMRALFSWVRDYRRRNGTWK